MSGEPFLFTLFAPACESKNIGKVRSIETEPASRGSEGLLRKASIAFLTEAGKYWHRFLDK